MDVKEPAVERLEREKRIVAREFDAKYYRSEYPDVDLPLDALVDHFCAAGWREGRNPCPYFDTVSYLAANDDVTVASINPFFHYLYFGINEGRSVSPAVTPSVRTDLLFGYSFTNWVERLRPCVNRDYYGAYLPEVMASEIDLVAHFAYRGWREGLSPSRDFDIRTLLLSYPEAKRLLVNPVLVRLGDLSGEYRIRREERLPPPPAPVPAPTEVHKPEVISIVVETQQAAPEPAPSATFDEAQISLIASAFSPEYYLAQNTDVANAGVDPLTHYILEGWKEGRNPNKEFDTSYYLAANADVAGAGINPFWHYLAEGQREGRRPCRPGGYRRRTIDAARAPERRTDGYVLPVGEPSVDQDGFARIRTTLAKAKSGAIVALSHDCYIKSVGGTQIFISDEQGKFAKAGFAYLQLSPLVPLLVLAQPNDHFMVRVVLDNDFLGVCAIDDLLAAIKPSKKNRIKMSALVVHSALGFTVNSIIGVREKLNVERAFFWTHDYSSICAAFNLLRNDVAFCHAPPPSSMACRVCLSGPGRAAHLAGMQEIFTRCDFSVLAPSQYALDLWLAASNLPYRDAAVHSHWGLKAKRVRPAAKQRRDPKRVIAVAFLGVPLPSKGWGIFSTMVDRLGNDPRYRFLHFVSPEERSISGVTVVPTSVTRADRLAAIHLLRQHKVDIVAVLSTWPETFSFVTHEALVAGAYVVCMHDSGNVAAVIEATGRGRVLSGEDEMLDFFTTDGATALVQRLDEMNLPELTIVDAGTTATVMLPDHAHRVVRS